MSAFELAGIAAAWLAHAAWYVARPRDGVMLVTAAATRPTLARGVALALAGLSVACLVHAHGRAIGGACALAAVTAGASFHVIAGPLSPRAVRGGAIAAGLLLGAALVGVLRAG